MRFVLTALTVICALQISQGSIPARAAPPTVPALPVAISADRISIVAHDPIWLRLLHYRPSFPLGQLKSEVDGPAFFFSPQGKTDPEAELRASAEGFAVNREVGQLHQHPQCAFPERFRFVKQALGLHYAEVPCPRLDEFLTNFDGGSVTLVFSGAQQDSPATMFGHTFLRINSRKKGQSDLLDQGLSFAAVAPPEDGPLVFYWRGTTGGYRGQFAMLPYYLKVTEYTNSESRDLWEYHLNLNTEETARLLRHAWEIETNSWFDYFFFDENCAYQLLALLEVAKPEWNLTPFALYVIPGETIKRLTNIPGAVTDVHYRPSLKKQLTARIDAFTSDGKREFYALIEGGITPALVSNTEELETASQYFLYMKQKHGGKLPPEQLARMSGILSRRSELGAVTQVLYHKVLSTFYVDTAPLTRPDMGHNAIQVSLGGGSARYGTTSSTLFQETEIRSAYHDLLNDDTGYPRFSQIEFPSLALRYYPAPGVFEIDRLRFLSMVSLFPISRIERKPSWQLTLEYDSPKDYSCDTCHAVHLQGGPGVTTELFSPAYLGYLFILADWEDGSGQGRWFRAGSAFQAAAVMNPVPGYKMRLAATALTDLGQDTRSRVRYALEWGHSLKIDTQWDARLGWSAILNGSGPRTYYDETQLTLNHYF